MRLSITKFVHLPSNAASHCTSRVENGDLTEKRFFQLLDHTLTNTTTSFRKPEQLQEI